MSIFFCLNEARRSVWGLISGERCPLPDDVEAALLRICQELLANVRKHAQASRVDVNLNFERSAVSLSIRDNGVGFGPRALPEGAFGLAGTGKRVRLLGGEFVVRSEKVKGTLIQVKK